MRISFDLDDTLILSHRGSLCEAPLKFPYYLFYRERLRKGTVTLCRELAEMGYEICVYTTSERSVGYIRGFFRLYGIKLSKIINRQIHDGIVQGSRKEIMPSKVPSRFGMDLHVDDDITVKQNGASYGFNVLIIGRNDEGWADKVLDEARRIMRKKGNAQNR